MNMLKFDACHDKDMTEEKCQENKMDLFVGVDLASQKDFCSISKVYVGFDENQVKHYYCFTEQFLNENMLEQSNVESVRGWEKEGWIKTNRGQTTDLKIIENRIKEISKLKPKYIGFDKWQAAQMLQNLRDDGIKNVYEFGQNISHMSSPMKEFEASVLDGRFHFNGDPVFAWMVSNVVAHQDSAGNIKPVRDKNAKFDKIDSAVATIMAIGLSAKEKPKEKKYQIF